MGEEDAALLRGLRDRSCLQIELGVGHWRSGLSGESTCHQSWQLEFDPQDIPTYCKERTDLHKLSVSPAHRLWCAFIPPHPSTHAHTHSKCNETVLLYVHITDCEVYEVRVIAALPPPVNRAVFSFSWPSCCLLIHFTLRFGAWFAMNLLFSILALGGKHHYM